MTGPEDPAAARGDRLRVGHADREQVIETLKTAFVDGRRTRNELDARTGRALAARTRADLAALTADIPAAPAAAAAARPPTPARAQPLGKAAAKSVICLITGFAAMLFVFTVGSSGDPNPWAFFFVGAIFICSAVGILGNALATAADERRSRGQLPPRPRSDGHALDGERRDGTGHGPVPPGPRTDQTRTDLRAHQWRRHRQHAPARARRAARGVRPAPGAA